MNSASANLEDLDLHFESETTVSQVSLPRVAVLSLMLLVAQHRAYAKAAVEQEPVHLPELHQGSAQASAPALVSHADLVNALLEFHDRLVGTQEDLATEARRLLHDNLWQLYD